MSKFEFTITIVSIVIAFAISELMAGWGRVLRHQPSARHDWMFSGWSVGMLLLAVLHWSGLWLYEDVPFTSLWQLFLLLLPPLLLVAAAFLMAPNPVVGEHLELRAHFERIARPAFLLLAAFSLLSLFADWFVARESPLDWFSLHGLGNTALLIAAALSERVWVRAVALAVLWAFILPLALGLVPAQHPGGSSSAV